MAGETMKNKPLPQPLSGIIVPLLTPLRDRDTLDLEGLNRLIDHVIRGGVHGLFLLGTTGEGPSLSYRLRRELITHTIRQADGRVPVLVSISDTAFVESVELARFAAQGGADAVIVVPPFYLPEGQPELREYLEHLLPELPLPLYLYNMPPLTKVAFDYETVCWAMRQPRILGIKDSSANMVYFSQLLAILRERPEWTVLMGPEELLAPSVLMGGHGGVNGGANIYPRLYVQLYESARAGDLEKARDLQGRVLEVSQKLYRVGRYPSAIIKGLKCAASCLGLCNDFMAEPFHRFRRPERQCIEQAMEELKDVVNA